MLVCMCVLRCAGYLSFTPLDPVFILPILLCALGGWPVWIVPGNACPLLPDWFHQWEEIGALRAGREWWVFIPSTFLYWVRACRLRTFNLTAPCFPPLSFCLSIPGVAFTPWPFQSRVSNIAWALPAFKSGLLIKLNLNVSYPVWVYCVFLVETDEQILVKCPFLSPCLPPCIFPRYVQYWG